MAVKLNGSEVVLGNMGNLGLCIYCIFIKNVPLFCFIYLCFMEIFNSFIYSKARPFHLLFHSEAFIYSSSQARTLLHPPSGQQHLVITHSYMVMP